MAKMQIDQFAEFSATILRCFPRNIEAAVAQRFITNPGALRQLLQDAMLTAGNNNYNERAYTLEVNYNSGIKSLVEAGNYEHFDTGIFDWYHEGERRRYGSRDEYVYLITNLGCLVTDTYEFTDELDKLCLKPAPLECLLAFGVKYPELQREYPILTISEYRDEVACLLTEEGRRELHVVSEPEGLIYHRAVLAVGKTSDDCARLSGGE